jgi:hypothetical protein
MGQACVNLVVRLAALLQLFHPDAQTQYVILYFTLAVVMNGGTQAINLEKSVGTRLNC